MAKRRKKFVLMFDNEGNAMIRYPEDNSEDIFPVTSSLKKKEVPEKFTPFGYRPSAIN